VDRRRKTLELQSETNLVRKFFSQADGGRWSLDCSKINCTKKEPWKLFSSTALVILPGTHKKVGFLENP
jgi:hypothetical protein